MIQNFITQVKGRGLARTNRFVVQFGRFPAIASINARQVELAELMCDAVQLPGINIATTPSKMYGEVREIPYERMFEPLNLSFYVDAQYDVKSVFERWAHSIINQTSRSIQYYNNYIMPMMVIHSENVDGSFPYYARFFEVYPKSVQAVALDSSSRDVMKLNVILQYKYWNSKSSAGVNAQSTTLSPADAYNEITGVGGVRLDPNQAIA